jgi:pheromone alpha factor receptor
VHIGNGLLQLQLVLLNPVLSYTLDQIHVKFSLDFHTNRSHHLEAPLHTIISTMAEAAAPPPPFDPATFDPWHQDINMYMPDGSLLTVNMGLVDKYRLYTTRLSISFGSQIGGSLMLLLVLVLLTRSEKRKSLIFILNACCLFFNTIRLIFASCYLTGNLVHPYNLLSGVYFSTPTDIAVSVTSNTLSFVVLAFIMASLSLQVWVACVTTSTLQRILIMGITTAMALVSLGFKFAFMVASHIALVESKVRDVDKLSAISWITQGVAIMLYSCVFTWKLGYAIMQRRRLNMLQFGPMQIVFIMGCQTMIIPGKFLPKYCCTLLTVDSSLVGHPVPAGYPK